MLMMHRNSIRHKLFISISIVIIVSLGLISLLGFFGTRKEIQQVLDANMAKSAKLVLSLIYHEIKENEKNGFLDDFEDKINAESLHKYENKIHIQVWRNDELVYISDRKFTVLKSSNEGFEDVEIDGEEWRRFSLYDADSNVTISILEQYEIRNELIWKILASPFIPMIISSLMIFAIWFFIDNKIGALNKLSNKIASMSPNTLSPFNDLNPPVEIQPLVTSLNDLILRLNNSMESERRFTDYAAHELRTPLSVIKTQVQLLRKNKNKEKEEEYFYDLEKAVDRLIHLVNQVLILARLEPENSNFDKEKISLNNLVNAEISNSAKLREDKKLRINFVEKNEIFYAGNKTYIEIMVRNLIDNAIKYSIHDSEIEISLEQNDKKIIFKISNFGNEISDRQQQKLFDAFYRVKGGEENGCGLGLAIAKKISKLHQGEISFSSKKIDDTKALNSVEVVLV